MGTETEPEAAVIDPESSRGYIIRDWFGPFLLGPSSRYLAAVVEARRSARLVYSAIALLFPNFSPSPRHPMRQETLFHSKTTRPQKMNK